MAIDYGSKRCGIAVSDALRSIAFPLDTVAIHELYGYLDNYFKKEIVDLIVIGEPRNLDDSQSSTTNKVHQFYKGLAKKFPDKEFTFYDERFTSKLAAASMILSGQNKKVRQDKGNLDKVSATILLQDYLQSNNNKR